MGILCAHTGAIVYIGLRVLDALHATMWSLYYAHDPDIARLSLTITEHPHGTTEASVWSVKCTNLQTLP